MRKSAVEGWWFSKLTLAAKAEILSGLLHRIFDHEQIIAKQLPEDLQSMCLSALADCSVWDSELTDIDVDNIRHWYNEQHK